MPVIIDEGVITQPKIAVDYYIPANHVVCPNAVMRLLGLELLAKRAGLCQKILVISKSELKYEMSLLDAQRGGNSQQNIFG